MVSRPRQTATRTGLFTSSSASGAAVVIWHRQIDLPHRQGQVFERARVAREDALGGDVVAAFVQVGVDEFGVGREQAVSHRGPVEAGLARTVGPASK